MPADKRCTKCGETKPLQDFHRLSRSSDGHQPRCKACACRITREWSAANTERKRESDRRYREENAEQIATTRLAYRVANREREARRARAWHAANPDRAATRARGYYATHADAIKANAKAWREENPERKRENDRRFRAQNNERVREYQRRYRAHKAGVEVGPVDRAAIFERDHGLCGICGGPVDSDDWHLDHVIPLSQGGPHVQENMQVSHPRCNRAKGGRLSG